MTKTRLAATLSAGVIVTLTLGGCFPLGLLTQDDAPSESTPTGETVAPELQGYYDQVLTWESCGSGAQCTTVVAPMDWENPSEATDIELALTRHVAGGTALGSLFVNPGGPGGSGYDFIHDSDSLDYAVSENLQENFDVIGWDPRGVGKSTPVTCYGDAELDEYLFGIPPETPETPEWVVSVTAAAKEFADSCLAGTGESLGFVDTKSTVRDLDLMRALVGDTKLNYLGYSYGSEIGTTYIDEFPAKVGRLVLDGALDPTLSNAEVIVTQSAAFEKTLHSYLAACPELDNCPFTGNLDADLATIRADFDRLQADPIPGADGRLLDGYVLDTATTTALYSEDSWPYLNDLYSEIAVGETQTAFLLADFYYGRENGRYVDNSFQSFIAVQCLDYETITDPAETAALSAAIVAAAPTFNRPSILGDVLCGNWPFPFRGDAPAPASGVGADPVLVISTTGDPATPYQWGVALSQQLANGHLVSFTGEGHTAYNKTSDCVNSTVDDYFITGTVPAADPQC